MTQTKTWPDREAVAKIVEAAIADTLSMHWVTARDNATDAILALFPPPDDGWKPALLEAHEALATACEWFWQREAEQRTTNSEGAIFQRLSNVSGRLEALLDLTIAAPTPEGEGRAAHEGGGQ